MDQNQQLHPGTVLVVDDEPDICSQLNLFLSHEGYLVVTAPNGVEALRLFIMHRPVVTITDYHMPAMNGLELLHKIKEDSPAAQVIFVSGQADMRVALKAIKEHAFDFLPKPIDLVEVKQKVTEALEQWRKHNEQRAAHGGGLVEHDVKTEPRLVSILHINCDLDELTRHKVSNAIQHFLIEGVLAPRVVISLNHVSRINNVGLNLLLDISRDLKEARKTMVLSQVNQTVFAYLKVLGYHDYFTIHQALENAIAIA